MINSSIIINHSNTKKILINASNLHNGGGVQVASSFIMELAKELDRFLSCEVFIYVSSEVNNELMIAKFDRTAIKNYFVFNVHGLKALKVNILKRFKDFDLIFSIFGPFYLSKIVPNHIVGFAQLWILYPKNESSQRLPLRSRLLVRLKFSLQWLFFKRSAALLVVESKHVKDRLVAFKNYPVDRICVVNNCVSALYFDAAKWLPLPTVAGLPNDVIKIGYVARAYPHKNLQVLLALAHELVQIGTLKFQFFVTLNTDEWASFTPEYRATITNIGSLTVTQCPTFYQAMDGVVFTSLLECFSATPLEALAMKRPLFASDRGFVRDCCAEHAIYIDPLDAKDIATKMHAWFAYKPVQERAIYVEEAYRHVLSLPNSKDRALGYINIINQQLNRTRE